MYKMKQETIYVRFVISQNWQAMKCKELEICSSLEQNITTTFVYYFGKNHTICIELKRNNINLPFFDHVQFICLQPKNGTKWRR